MKKLLLLFLFVFMCAAPIRAEAVEFSVSSNANNLVSAIESINSQLARYASTAASAEEDYDTEVTLIIEATASSMNVPAAIELPYEIDVDFSYTVVDEDGRYTEEDNATFSITNLEIKGTNTTLRMSEGERHFTVDSECTLALSSVDLDGNGDGGGIEVSGGRLVLENVSFNHCNGGDGGALNIGDDSNVTFNGAISFTDNAASGSGGAVYSTADITLSSADFSGNTAESGGGAIYSEGTVSISSADFSRNSAVENGGAIYSTGTMTLANVNFSHNSIQSEEEGSGGAVYSEGTLRISNANISNNDAVDNGGAIYSSGTMAISGVLFAENNAKVGGAIYAEGSSARILNCTFDSNMSVPPQDDYSLGGGAAYLAASSENLVANCTFYSNSTIRGRGGALHLAGSSTAVLTSTFTGNRAVASSGLGGGIYMGSPAVMFGNLLVGNSSGSSEGGNDVSISSGAVSSAGYNILTDSVPGITDTDAVSADFKAENFFNTRNGTLSKIGEDGKIWVLELRSISTNVALAFISNSVAKEQFTSRGLAYEDALGNSRPGTANWDAGSYQRGGGRVVVAGDLASIRIGGIPNTMRTPGQTVNLSVKGYDQNGTLIANNVSVDWSLSPEGTIASDDSGKLYVTNSYIRIYQDINSLEILRTYYNREKPYILITATVPDTIITDSVRLYVTDDNTSYSPTNVYPNSQQARAIEAFNAANSDLEFDVDQISDSSLVRAAVFQSEFIKAWPGSTPSQIEKIDGNINLSSENMSSYSYSGGFKAEKKGIKVSITDCSDGEMLPLIYSWIYTPGELAKLLGSNWSTSKTPSREDLSKILQVVFRTDRGNSLPVLGSDAVAVRDAIDIDPYSTIEGEGAKVILTAYITNTLASSNPALISSTGGRKLLIVPDGVEDSNISGTMIMLQKATTGSSNGGNDNPGANKDDGSGDSGGGGCNAYGTGLSIFALALTILKRK